MASGNFFPDAAASECLRQQVELLPFQGRRHLCHFPTKGPQAHTCIECGRFEYGSTECLADDGSDDATCCKPSCLKFWQVVSCCWPSGRCTSKRPSRSTTIEHRLDMPCVTSRDTSPEAETPVDDLEDGFHATRYGDPQVGPQIGLQVGPQIDPQDGPEVEPQVGPQDGPQDGPEAEPQVGSQDGPQDGSEAEPQVGSQDGSQDGSEAEPQVGSQDGSEAEPQVGSQDGSQDGSEAEPQARDPEEFAEPEEAESFADPFAPKTYLI